MGQKVEVLSSIFCGTKITLEWITPSFLDLPPPPSKSFEISIPPPPNYNWEGGLNYDNIVLPTAEEYFKWKRKEYSKKIILFDNGAQHTYISKELKEKLNLVPFKQEKIAVNVFDRTEESKVQNIDVKFIVISGRKNVYVGA